MRKKNYEEFMRIAIKEATISLKEGNNGFGAVLVKDSRIIATAHDSEVTDSDPTAHAEMNHRIKSTQFLITNDDTMLRRVRFYLVH
jgi:tRNA(Arg) A34 adenosine deaminase TadA